MKRRGQTLSMVMVIVSLTALAGIAFCVRQSIFVNGRPQQAARDQALWLGRSACATKSSGTVETPSGRAVVTREGSTMHVTIDAMSIDVPCAPIR